MSFSFLSSPQFIISMQSEISKKNVFVPWGISKVVSFLPDILFKGNLKAYYKVRQLDCYYKVRQLSILKSATTSCKVSQVLQSVTVLFQSGTGTTKSYDYCKVR